MHEPGPELDHTPPSLMDELLFDDILFGPRARMEHRYFTNVLTRCGVEVFDFYTLLTETLSQVDEVERLSLVKLLAMHGHMSTKTELRLNNLSPSELAAALVHGLPAPADERAPDHLFDLNPTINLMFSRDAQVVMGNGIIFSAMKYHARKREAILSQFVFTRHPQLKVQNVIADFTNLNLERRENAFGSLSIEGGDILAFKEGIVLVGVSQRTTEYAVSQLARKLKGHEFFKTLIILPMPAQRSLMHLDTIFTRLSEDECLVYAPMIVNGSAETLTAISIDLNNFPKDYGKRHASLLDALKHHGVDLKPIYCGGRGDYIQQAREQWTDGANSFTISPGVCTLYARNMLTIEEMDANGYQIVECDQFESADGQTDPFALTDGKKYLFLLPSMELSRGRGGPRCMTMPLRRDRPH